MSTSSTFPSIELADWQTELVRRITSRRDEIVREYGEKRYNDELRLAQELDEEALQAYRTWRAASDAAEGAVSEAGSAARGEDLVAALEASREEILSKMGKDLRNSRRVKERLDREIESTRLAAEGFTKLRNQFGALFGDPEDAMAEFLGREKPARDELTNVIMGLASFSQFKREADVVIEEVRAKDPEAELDLAVLTQTSLGKAFEGLVRDRFAQMGASSSISTSDEAKQGETRLGQGAAFQVDQVYEAAKPIDKKKIETARPDFERLARLRTSYLHLAANADEAARLLVEKGQATSFREARDTVVDELQSAWDQLTVLHDRLPKLKDDEFFMPARPRKLAEGGRERVLQSIAGSAVRVLDRAARGFVVRGVLGEERALEARAGLQALAPTARDPDKRRLFIFPGNLETAVGDLVEGGLLGGGFKLAGATVGQAAARSVAARGGGRVAQAAATGVATGAGGMALSPFAETPKEHALGILGGGVAGGVVGTAAGALQGALAAPAERQAAIAAIERPRVAAPTDVGPPGPPVVGRAPAQVTPPSAQVPTPAPRGAVSAEPPVPITERLLLGVKEAKPVRAEQKRLVSAERRKRLGRVIAIGQEDTGKAGFIRQMQALKGEYPKAEYEPIAKRFSAGEIDELYGMLETTNKLSPFEKISAKKGLAQLLEDTGLGVPQPNQIDLLGRVFGEEFAEELAKKSMGRVETTTQQIAEVLGIPRVLKAGIGDLSASLRQAVLIPARYPREWARAFADELRFFKSPEKYEQFKVDLVNRPNYDRMRKAGLALTAVRGSAHGKKFNRATQGEEQYVSQKIAEAMLQRIGLGKVNTLIRASSRAYDGFLTKLRADLFDELEARFKAAGHEVEDKAIADYINTWTGRGGLGGFEGAGGAAATVLFSPRFVTSRMAPLNPLTYARMPAPVRKEALASAFSTVAAGLTILTIAKLMGAETEGDPTSADFGKIKVGNTRLDVWGGFSQYPRILAQVILGRVKSSTTGRSTRVGEMRGTSKLTRKRIIQDFFENKLAPVPGFANRLFDEGKNFDGTPITIPSAARELFVPIIVEDAIDIAQTDPTLLPFLAASILGIGQQTYPTGSALAKITRRASMSKNPDPDILMLLERLNRGEDREQIERDAQRLLDDYEEKARGEYDRKEERRLESEKMRSRARE